MTLSKAVLALRTASLTMRDKTATVISPTFLSDGMGGFTTSWATLGTYSCRLSPEISSRDTEKVIGERLKSSQIFSIFLPHTATVNEDYRIIVDGQQYEILQIIPPQSYLVEIRVLTIKASDHALCEDP